MNTVEFLSYLRSLDIQVWVEGDRLRCNAPEGSLTPELRSDLAKRKAEVIAFLRQVSAKPTELSLAPISRNSAPLSFAQQRLWFLEQLAPGNPFYNVPTAVRLTGLLHIAALEQTFNEIVRRHEALRTTFRMVTGQLVQVIAPHLSISLDIVDLQPLPTNEREQQAQRLTTEESQKPFDLACGPLLRVKLLRLNDTEHVLLLTMHHIVSDGWSIGVLIQELEILYAVYTTDQPSPLNELPIQYADFAAWQRQWLQGEVLSSQLAYWRQQLADLPALDLPTDRTRPAVQSYRGATEYLEIFPGLGQLLDLSQQAEVTLFITLLAAFQTLLYRYTGQSDIAVGSPIANRNRSEIEGLIGFFVNSLVLRADLSGNPTFRELLGRVREVALGAYAHQDLPFERLVEELQPERDLSRNPLFQVVFALQNAPVKALELPGLTLNHMNFDPGTTRFDLEFHVSYATNLGSLGGERRAGGERADAECADTLNVMAIYNTDLFDAATIRRMLSHFQILLTGIVAQPEQRLSDLPLLSESDRYQLLVAWNQTQVDYPRHLCVHQFEAQVKQTPDAIALVFKDEQLTYRELNSRSNQLAHYLQALGVQNTLVGICVKRSWQMVVGLLGILKAGAAYVPLDHTYPQERLSFMLEDAQVSVLLTQQDLVSKLANNHLKSICLDQDWHTIAQQPQENPVNLTCVNDLVYVIYTSGSTGKPKGVAVEHGSLSNLIFWHQTAFAVSSLDRATQIAGTAFDACGWELFPYLTAGASIYFPDEETRTSPTRLRDWLVEQQITLSFLPTPLAERMLTLDWHDTALRILLTGGDKLQQAPPTSLPFTVVNNYGPTENTVVTTSGCVEAGQDLPTIGRPIANIQVYLLDAHLQTVPVGARGELYISGAGLARGYLNLPELTAERFISHPFQSGQGECDRLYKTGDLARYRPNGTLEFLGRVDEQVKLRGFRIELAEIEAVLSQHPAVGESVVISYVDKSGDKRLAAYVTTSSGGTTGPSQPLLQDEQILQWQMLYEETYSRPATHADSTFNIIGWNSSYTGQPLPAEEIREWVDHRVEQILSLQPKRVLEIGCGTGLLLFRIAPHCSEYWGTDFAQVSLNYIQQQLEKQMLPQVKLFQKLAHDFEGVESGSFDAVILNSVVQYFPSIDYFLQVLAGAVKSVAPGGFVFLGDIRSLPLLLAFHTSVELFQAEPSLSKEQLQQRVQTRLFQETELVIDPAFFTALSNHFPQVSQVQIQLTEGRYHNEMTQWRYNVILHIGEVDSPLRPPEQEELGSFWLDWSKDGLTVETVRQRLLAAEPEILGLTQVPNARVTKAVKAAAWLSSEAPETIGEFRASQVASGIDPEDLRALEEELPYTVHIGWSDSSAEGCYDVVFVQRQSAWEKAGMLLPLSQHQAHRSWQNYANNPLQAKSVAHLVPQLRLYLGEKLPDYMVPSAFMVLEALPITSNGKVNRRALPAPNLMGLQQAATYVSPQTAVEERLVGIWSSVLGLKQIGIYDNFFELGGHSLLATQLVSRIRDAFQVELPLRSLFEAPTIAGLAQEITRREGEVKSLTPAIAPISRETRRMKLSSLNRDNKGHFNPAN